MILHLMAWQQISNARIEAARDGGEPRLPLWLGRADPFYAEDHTTDFNARIRTLYTDEPWARVHRAWREGFLRLIEVSQALPEQDMLDPNKYPWLKGYALSAVIAGSCDHHEEHLDELPAANK